MRCRSQELFLRSHSPGSVRVSERGSFPLWDLDVGGTTNDVSGFVLSLDSTWYYRVNARDESENVTAWHAKLPATFRSVRRVQLRPT